MYKLIALYGGGLRATLEADSGVNGCTRVTLITRENIAVRLTAHLVDEGGRIHSVKLSENLHGMVDGSVMPRAALITIRETQGVRFLLTGGTFCSGAEFESVKRDIRIRESSITKPTLDAQPQENAPEKTAEEEIREEVRSEALRDILKMAAELFSPIEGKDTALKDVPVFNPFPEAFPRSSWKRISYPGTNRFYLEGEAMKDGMKLLIHALPGEYSPIHPMRNSGFKKFLRASDGSGYWLKIRRKR